MSYQPKHRAPKASSAVPIKTMAGVATGAIGAAALTAVVAPPVQAASVWDRVAQCESGGNWGISTGNGYYGGLQFSASTWSGHGGGKYASTAHRATRAQQIAIAQNVLKSQGPGAWPVCSRKAGLTRSNGLAGRVVDKTSNQAPSNPVRSRTALSPSQTRDVQNWLNTAQSGRWTRWTTRALQHVVGADVDGVVGPQTVRMSERYLKLNASGHSQLSPSRLKALHAYAVAHS